MDMSYFNYCQGLTMTSAKFHRLFGGPPREPESPLTQREMDLAASIQVVTEEIMLRMARHVHARDGHRRTSCLAGGVALNCVGNGRILREGPFENIWIQPAAGDAGGALGAALFIWHQLLDKPANAAATRQPERLAARPASSPTTRSQTFLDAIGAVYTTFDRTKPLCDEVAELIAQEKVVGWFQGRMEFGPRALGRRSILGDARSAKMQSVMNLKIKFRESFRPFAPSVLQRARRRVLRDAARRGQPVHAARGAGAGRACARSSTPSTTSSFGIDKLKSRALDDPGGHARRLLGARPDGRRRAARPLLTGC